MKRALRVQNSTSGRLLMVVSMGLLVTVARGFEFTDTIDVVQQPVFPRIEPRAIDDVRAIESVDPTLLEIEQLEMMVRAKVDDFAIRYDLTDAQQKRLRLAARNDLRTIEREARQLIHAWESTKHQAVRKKLIREIESLTQRFFSSYEQESFFTKSLANIMTDDQMRTYRADLAERVTLLHRSNIESTLREIERKVVLSHSQFESLVNLSWVEIPAPTAHSVQNELIVKVRFARIPHSKIKPIFNNDQWPVVRDLLDEFQMLESSVTAGFPEVPADALRTENREECEPPGSKREN